MKTIRVSPTIHLWVPTLADGTIPIINGSPKISLSLAETTIKREASVENRAVYADERQAALAMPFSEWLELAMDAAGVPDDERADGSVWLGGLACPFGEYYLPARGRAGFAETVADTAFDNTLEEEREDPLWHFSFCLDHQCNVNSGLIGNTNTTGEMSAYFWVEKKASDLGPPGLYNLARAAEYEGSPGLLAAEAVARDGVQGQSIGFWIVDEDPDEEGDVNGKEMMLYTIWEIDLVEGSGVDHAAYTTTFIRSGVYGGDVKDKKSEEVKTEAHISSEYRDGFQVRCGCRLHEDTAKAQRADIESVVRSPKGVVSGGKDHSKRRHTMATAIINPTEEREQWLRERGISLSELGPTAKKPVPA